MNKLIENIHLLLKQTNTKTEQTVARMMFNNSMTISVAESCTGGLVSSRLTDIPGSSVYIKENYITYSNEAKIKLLGVNKKVIDTYGAVSEECAIEMVKGLCKKTDCDIALATTGIAGPSGGNEFKKVGLLYVAVKNKYSTKVQKFELPNYDRKTMK